MGALSIIVTMQCVSRKECAEPLRLSSYPLWLFSNPEKSLPRLGQARPPQGKPLQRDSAERVKRVVDTCVQRLLLCSANGHCLLLFLIGAPRLRLKPSCGTLSFQSRWGCPC